MTDLDLSHKRLSYQAGQLRRADLHPDPVQQFGGWLNQALEAGLREPYAFALATASAGGVASVRTVLLRHATADGLSFYTNYHSNKGRDLEQNPHAEALFFWAEAERQVRASGPVVRLSDAENDAYFASRPRESQLAAHVSTPQSGPVPSREALERAWAQAEERYPGDVPRPDFWGGYRLLPSAWEFWQGRPGRLHDRLRYTQQGGGWHIERLMP